MKKCLVVLVLAALSGGVYRQAPVEILDFRWDRSERGNAPVEILDLRGEDRVTHQSPVEILDFRNDDHIHNKLVR